MRYQLFTPEPDNGVTGNPGEYQPVIEDRRIRGTQVPGAVVKVLSVRACVSSSTLTPRIFTYIRVHVYLVKY
jgi:hypothetical protein